MNTKTLAIIIKAQDQASKVMEEVGDSAEKANSRMGKAFDKASKVAKIATVATATAFTAMIGKFVVSGGISRALNIEDAQAKLKGLGHDVGSVQTIMDSALKSVKGTAYGLDSAATLAATAVAAGIKPGIELTKYLTLTADAATIAGSSLDDMGNVMNNVTTLGAAYNDSLQILAQKGLPIYTWLAEEMGVTEAAVKDLASEGKVSSEVFRAAIEKNISGAALESGATTRGTWANLLAAMSRIGAQIVQGPIDRVRVGMGDLTKWIDDNASKIVGALDKGFDIASTSAGKFVDWVSGISKKVNADDWHGVGMSIGSAISVALNGVIDKLGPMLDRGLTKLEGLDWVGIGIKLGKNAIGFVIGLAAGILDTDWGAVFQGIWNNLDTILWAGLGLVLLPAKWATGISSALGKIPFVGTMLKWFFDVFTAVSKWVGEKAMDILKAFSDGFANAVGIVAPNVMGSLRGFLSLIPTQIGVWAISAWNAAKTLVAGVGGAIGEGVFPMVARGQQLIKGLWDGMVGMFGGAVGWAAGIGGRILNSIGNLGHTLWNAGASILQGFWNGMASKWEAVKGFVSGIAQWIKDHKGPIDYDRKLLVGAGEAIMDGFNRGLIGGFENVKRTVSSIAGDIDNNLNTTFRPTVSAGHSPLLSNAGVSGTDGAQVKSGGSAGTKITINMLGPTSMNSQQDIETLAQRVASIINQSNEIGHYGAGI